MRYYRWQGYDECNALLRAIFAFCFSHVFVMRKLESIEVIIFSNFFIGTAKVRISTGTQGRADGIKHAKHCPGTFAFLLQPGIVNDR